MYFAAFPHAITLDGRLEDWAGVPQVLVRDGQKPGPDPSDNGSMTFAVTADADNIYLLGIAPDKKITAGQSKDFWREDSLEFYLNTTGNLSLPKYSKGIVQLTVPAVNIGVPIERAQFGGINGANAEARAFVFRTPDGYAMEVAIPLRNKTWQIAPKHGLTLGFEVQLNGSSGNTQDSVLNWVYRAGTTGHPSNMPSLFGKLVFYQIGETTMPEQTIQATTTAPDKSSTDLTTAAYRKGNGQPSPTVGLEPPKSRNPRLWPFAKDSIWNTPIGSGAVYAPAKLEPASTFAFDQDLFFEAGAAASWHDLHPPGNWGKGRCTGASQQNARGQMLLPEDAMVADATGEPFQTPNNAAAILLPDGRTVTQLEPMTRCERAGPVFGYRATDQDLYGDGLWGGHFGSGLSSIGGTIRHGELLGDGPIRHALKLKLWAKKYLSYEAQSNTPGFRWPAIRADSGAGNLNSFNAYGTLEPAKSNPVKGMVMGSLLAIPQSVTLELLGIDPKLKLYLVLRKLFRTLQEFGAYIDDNTGWDAHYFGAEYGVNEELQAVLGEGLNGVQGETLEAINKLFVALSVVNNNSPVSIGGGGMPLAPNAPEFAQSAPKLQARALERNAWTLDAFASADKHPVARITDGRAGTFWRSGRPQGVFQDIKINLGGLQTIRQLRMISGAFGQDSYHRWARDFTLETSLDGKNWMVVAGTAGAPTVSLSFRPTPARYVRITQANQDLNDWAISDLQLYR